MTAADKFEFPQGTPLFNTAFRSISEGIAGVGYLSPGNINISTTANALEIEVSGGSLWYPPNDTTYSLSTTTFTLSSGDNTYDRYDLIYYDTAAGTIAVREGTPEQYPDLPDITTGEAILGYAYVPATATNITDERVFNWSSRARSASGTRLNDADGNYSATNVEGGLSEIYTKVENDITQLQSNTVSQGGSIESSLSLPGTTGPALSLDESVGSYGPIVDMPLSSNLSGGNIVSYSFGIGGTSHFTVQSTVDGNGGIQFGKVLANKTLEVSEDIQDDNLYTIYDYSDRHVPREQVDDERLTQTVTTTARTTAGEEVVFVDTAAIGSASTVTLASADASEGNTIVVSDLSGSASSNPITVDTEGSETIAGTTSRTIDSDGGALVFVSDGTDWSLGGGGGGGPTPQNAVRGREGGSVPDGDDGIVTVDDLPDGATVNIYKATLTDGTVQPVPSGVDLNLVTFSSGSKTTQSTLISGDGSTVFDAETGTPLGSYTNSSGSTQTIGVVASNGSGSAVDVFASVEGEKNV